MWHQWVSAFINMFLPITLVDCQSSELLKTPMVIALPEFSSIFTVPFAVSKDYLSIRQSITKSM